MINIFVYANCQGNAFKYFLPKIIDTPINLSIVENYIALSGEVELEHIRSAARAADVFIYQPLEARHGHFSTQPEVDGSVVTWLRPECVRISMPYIYNDALWPLFANGSEYINEHIIQDYLRCGATAQDIWDIYDAGELDFNFSERLNTSLSILKERESRLDIRVGDFIEENLRKIPLFMTQNHPTTAVFAEVMAQTIAKLDVPSDKAIKKLRTMARRADKNAVKLPGYYPIGKYSFEYYRFDYVEAPEPGADQLYKRWISDIAAKYRAESKAPPSKWIQSNGPDRVYDALPAVLNVLSRRQTQMAEQVALRAQLEAAQAEIAAQQNAANERERLLAEKLDYLFRAFDENTRRQAEAVAELKAVSKYDLALANDRLLASQAQLSQLGNQLGQQAHQLGSLESARAALQARLDLAERGQVDRDAEHDGLRTRLDLAERRQADLEAVRDALQMRLDLSEQRLAQIEGSRLWRYLGPKPK